MPNSGHIDVLVAASNVLILTGAGISAESGIPTFRGINGLYEGMRVEDLASPAGFAADPERVWQWYVMRASAYGACEPNPGHRTLVEMAAAYPEFLISTQNVDGLHQKAGSPRVIELHGTITTMRCTRCEQRAAFPLPWTGLPSCSSCGAMMRPDILWFGETYRDGVLERTLEAAAACDVCISIGTSGAVWTPVHLAMHARAHGATLIDINPNESELSGRADHWLQGPAGDVLPRLWREVRALRQPSAG